MSVRKHRISRRVGAVGVATALVVGGTILPAEAAVATVFSSTYNLGVYACRYSSTAAKFGVRNYTSTPIYRVDVLNSAGSGTYIDYIPGYYGAKTQQYAQVIADGTKYVYVKKTSSSARTYLGRFTLTKSSLPAC